MRADDQSIGQYDDETSDGKESLKECSVFMGIFGH